MRMKLFSRLRRRGGFSLSETLVAVLILLMVSAVVAGGIPVAANVYRKVVDTANAQVLLSTSMTALRDELGTATEIVAPAGATSAAYTAGSGIQSRISLSDDGIFLEQYTDYPESIRQDYARLLVSKPAASRELVTAYGSIVYEDGIVTVTDLTVKKGTVTLAEAGSFQIKILSAGAA